ncbi:MAG: M28 family peptidase [Balneolaceae bacterium]
MNKFIVLFFLILLSCSSSDKKKLQFVDKGRDVPIFEADSAYSFIEKQLENGPRVPNTYGHVETRKYIVNKLQEYAGTNSVFVQYFEADGYSETLKLANIIAAFNPTAPDRIMLNAHWDTRPRADEDSQRSVEPIAGADDGASGVAVLLELARIFSEENPPIGVDIVLFDGEDYGTSGDLSRYFLGSRHWSKNPPVPGYNPRFGILLDMVGAENAFFPKEVNSIAYAPNLMEEVWAIAGQKGYGDIFLNEVGAAVIDDHYIITNETKIPVIDIINHTKGSDGNIQFAPHWHTHKDDLPIIDKNTLEAVGSVLLELIYNRI